MKIPSFAPHTTPAADAYPATRSSAHTSPAPAPRTCSTSKEQYLQPIRKDFAYVASLLPFYKCDLISWPSKGRAKSFERSCKPSREGLPTRTEARRSSISTAPQHGGRLLACQTRSIPREPAIHDAPHRDASHLKLCSGRRQRAGRSGVGPAQRPHHVTRSPSATIRFTAIFKSGRACFSQ